MVFLIAGPLTKSKGHYAGPRIAATGNDTLIASNDPGAQDVLIGGSGSDTLDTGSAGNDVVEVGSGSDTITCTSTATVTISGEDQGDQENGCQGQNVDNATTQWQGTIAALPSATTMDVNWSEQEGADAWLAANNNPNPVTFDISQATNENNSGCPLSVGDQVEVTANLPSSGTTLIGVTIDSQQGDSGCQGESQIDGTVTSVNGTSTSGTCGVAGATGTFALTGDQGTTTVEVTSTTTFDDPSFADVCVGVEVEVTGTLSSGTLTATNVSVQTDQQGGSGGGETQIGGTVDSVNGSTGFASCGTGGATGTFTLAGDQGTTTVDVISTTTFTDSSGASSSFASVCVGAEVEVTGSSTPGTLTATSVSVQSSQGSQS